MTQFVYRKNLSAGWIVATTLFLILVFSSCNAFLHATELADLQESLPEGAIIRLGTTRWRHSSDVICTAFSPDGKIIASAGRSEFIRLWDAATGKQLHQLDSAGRWDTYGFVFLKNGSQLASIHQNGKLRLWDLASGNQIGEFKTHPGEPYEPYGIAISPDGSRIGTIGRQELRLWNTDGLELIKAIPLNGNRLPSFPAIAFAPDGNLLAARAGPDVLLWSGTEDVEPRRIPNVHLNGVKSILFSGDSQTMITGGNGQPRNLQIGNQAGSAQAEIKIWKLTDRSLTGELIAESFDFGLGSLAMDDSGKFLYSSHNSEVRVWNLPEQKLVGVIRDDHWGQGAFADRPLSLSPDGKYFADRYDDDSVGLWDIRLGKSVRQAEGHSGRVTSVIAIGSGETVITGDGNGKVFSWNTRSGRLQSPITWNHSYKDQSWSMATSTDGSRMAFGGGARLFTGPDNKLEFQGHLAIVRLEDLGEEYTAKLQDVIGALAFSPDGKVIAAASKNHMSHRKPDPSEADEGLLLLDSDTGGLIRRISRKLGEVVLLDYAADGKKLFLLTTNGTLEEWDPETGEIVSNKIIEWYDKKLWLGSAGFTPDRKSLVSCSLFGTTLVLTDVDSGKLLRKFEIPETLGNRLAISPDGKWVASACQPITDTDKHFDERIHIWDLETGKELKTFDASSD
ncbi:MAG: hypothetical protein KDA36_03805, partial [Planctomycetaceae bacterium]|nr:hypothetical protein [Planctomycetaceae bacterium]